MNWAQLVNQNYTSCEISPVKKLKSPAKDIKKRLNRSFSLTTSQRIKKQADLMKTVIKVGQQFNFKTESKSKLKTKDTINSQLNSAEFRSINSTIWYKNSMKDNKQEAFTDIMQVFCLQLQKIVKKCLLSLQINTKNTEQLYQFQKQITKNMQQVLSKCINDNSTFIQTQSCASLLSHQKINDSDQIINLNYQSEKGQARVVKLQTAFNRLQNSLNELSKGFIKKQNSGKVNDFLLMKKKRSIDYSFQMAESSMRQSQFSYRRKNSSKDMLQKFNKILHS